MFEPIKMGMKIRLSLPFNEAVEVTAAALKEEGFGILTQIDVQGTLKQKLGADIDQYVILGACNPPLAHQAIQAAPDIGLLLPCNVIVYEDNKPPGTVVSIVDPLAMLEFADTPALHTVGTEARARLERVIVALESHKI